jgi:serine/threonine-protein kinase
MPQAHVTPPPTRMGTLLARRWRLVQKLGEGGMGEVYVGEPLAVGPRVAIKILRAEFVADANVLGRFLDEARTCMRLAHPNIVHVLESATAEDGAPYIAMELLEGVPLGAYTANGGRVPPAQAAPILQGILAGLAAAHAKGIVHRDLKPDNVFLTRAPDGTFVVKLLDFGIAKVMDIAGGMGARTRTGAFLGTPAYMSPEQVQTPRDVDPRSDLWSAGVLLYEMVTGQAPFSAATEYARLAAVLRNEAPPIERVDPSLAPLSAFMSRALRKNRGERFGSALEMASALEKAMAGFAGAENRAPSAAETEAMKVRAPSAGRAGLGQPAFVARDGANAATPNQANATADAAPEHAKRKPAATLASPTPSHEVSEPMPHVVVVPTPFPLAPPVAEPHGNRGIARWIVALLVFGAFAVGFALGWAFGARG